MIGKLAADLLNIRGASEIEEIAITLGVPSKQELSAYMILASSEKIIVPEGFTSRSKQAFSDLLRISNLISAQVLNYYLRHHPTRTQVALYLGKKHEEIVSIDPSEIPENLRFSDEEIKDLSRRREKRRINLMLRVPGIKLDERQGQEIVSRLDLRKPGIQSEAEGVPAEEDRISKVLAEMPSLPEGLRKIIEKWSKNLFDLKYVKRRGYNEYLNLNNYLHQLWGTAVLLAEKVEVAKSENRELEPEEIEEVERAFLKAATTSRKEGYINAGNEIEELAKNIRILAEIMRKL